MIEYFKKCVTTHYANFDGRARRSEFWFFYLAFILLFLLIGTISSILGFISVIFKYIGFFLIIVVLLGSIVPTLAVLVRRMHDVGKSGWFALIPFYRLILLFTDSQHGENEYGPNPKGIGNDDNYKNSIESIGKNI
jgi:uncharacterized membrane protein YhaH (DUF805 family)